MRPHSDYVLVGRRAALNRDFATMLDDLRSALASPRPAAVRRRQRERACKPQPELNDETLNDDRQSQHHPRRHSVRPRADRLAVFLQHAADGEAARRSSRRRAELAEADAAGRPPGTTPQTGRAGAVGHARPPSRPPPRPWSAAMPRIAASPRVKIDTPRLSGSISLKGARIDDLSLVKYPRDRRPEIARDRAVLALAAPPHPYYAEFGWVPATGSTARTARPEHGVAAGRLGRADADQPGDAEI